MMTGAIRLIMNMNLIIKGEQPMNKEQKHLHLFIENGIFGIDINKEDEHEIINALENIKSNMIKQLKELGVEV